LNNSPKYLTTIRFFSLLLFSITFFSKAQVGYYRSYDAGAALSQDMRAMCKTLDGGLAFVATDSITKVYKTDINGYSNMIPNWKYFYRISVYSQPAKIFQDQKDSSYYVLNNSPGFYYMVNKLSKSGQYIWTKYSTAFSNIASAVCSAKGGGFFNISRNGGTYMATFQRYDTDGNVVWANQLNLDSVSYYNHAIQCKNGDFVAVGEICNNSRDPIIIRVDSGGNLKWFKRYPSAIINDALTAVTEAPDSTLLYLGGNYIANYPMFYFKTDSNGALLQHRRYRSIHDLYPSTILSGSKNSLVIAGSALYPGFTSSQFLICYLDHQGNIKWSRSAGNVMYNGGGADYINCGVTINSNKFVMAAYGEGKTFMMMDSTGTGFCNSDTLNLSDSTFAITPVNVTYTFGTSSAMIANGGHTPYLVNTVLTTQCQSLPTGLKDEEEDTWRIFPNPNKGIFYIFSERETELSIYDVNGRMISELKLEAQNSLKTSFTLNEGIYFVKGEGVMKKLVVIR
jgi:hypothetical protein